MKNQFDTQKTVLSSMNWGNQDFDPIGHELRLTFKEIIISSIAGNSACPHEQVIAATLSQLPDSLEINVLQAKSFISIVLDSMVSSGEVTRLSYRSENQIHIDYYPRDTIFEVRPSENFSPKNELAPITVPVEFTQAVTAVTYFLDDLNKYSSKVPLALAVIQKFCPHCGALKEGHKCKTG